MYYVLMTKSQNLHLKAYLVNHHRIIRYTQKTWYYEVFGDCSQHSSELSDYRAIPGRLTGLYLYGSPFFYIRYPGDFYVPPTFIFTYLPRAFTHACRQNPQNVWHKTFFQSLKTLNFFTNFDNFTAFYKFRQISHFLAFFYTIRHSTNLEFFTAFYKFRHLLCILFIAYIFFIFP